MAGHDEDCSLKGERHPYPQDLDHPLNKIFGGIPAGSSDLTHASVRRCEKIEIKKK